MSKQTLVEIKRGQTGTGLLIENDGYISINDKENHVIKEAIELGQQEGKRNIPFPFVVSAVFQKYGVENANGRVYPEAILKREVEKYQQAIKEKRAYSELNHPESSSIDLGRLCMNVIELHWEGHTLVGKIEIPISDGFRFYGIVSTLADMAAQWIISGLRIGVSSRALGSVTQQAGRLIVSEDLELVCFDIVSQPSTPGAWIDTDPENLRPYVESQEKQGNVITENKYSKFTNWLND